MTSYESIERQSALKIAQEYRDKGYEVSVEPGPDALPDFLRGYQPALIAQSGQRNVVVEVKSFATLVGPNRLSELTEAVQGRPDWRLELVVVNPKRSSRAENPSAKIAIQDRLADAAQLRDEGYSRAALLTSVSALEAALSLAIMSSGVSRTELSGLKAADALLNKGRLTAEEYGAVAEGLSPKNTAMNAPSTLVSDERLIDRLLPIIQTLLERVSVADVQPALAAA